MPVRKPEKRERGRGGTFTAHKPTAEMREMVRLMSGYGLPLIDIAYSLGLKSVHTLKRHYPLEMDEGKAAGNLDIAKSLFFQGVGRPAEYEGAKKIREELRPNPTVAIFLGKTRLGLVEDQKITISVDDIDLTRLTEKEAETLAIILAKADRRAPVNSIDAESASGGGDEPPKLGKGGPRAPSEPE